MRHSDFQIGCEFMTLAGRWRCTDIGTRTIVAIRIDLIETGTIIDGTRSDAISRGKRPSSRDGSTAHPMRSLRSFSTRTA
jgi:hypothetical protein